MTTSNRDHSRVVRWRAYARIRRTAGTWIAAIMAVVVAAGGLVAVSGAAPAAASPRWRPDVQHERSVRGTNLVPRRRPTPTLPAWVVPPVTWPAAGVADAALGRAGAVRAGQLPVWVGPP
ncbi:MAG TPA: hypothetical protein VGJ44_01865, partial [Kribbellaceae bacterium]